MARGVWGYGENRVLFTLGWVPFEEYLFFVLQTLLDRILGLAAAPAGIPAGAEAEQTPTAEPANRSRRRAFLVGAGGGGRAGTRASQKGTLLSALSQRGPRRCWRFSGRFGGDLLLVKRWPQTLTPCFFAADALPLARRPAGAGSWVSGGLRRNLSSGLHAVRAAGGRSALFSADQSAWWCSGSTLALEPCCPGSVLQRVTRP